MVTIVDWVTTVHRIDSDGVIGSIESYDTLHQISSFESQLLFVVLVSDAPNGTKKL